MTHEQLDAIRVVAYAVDTYANAVEDIRALLDYCRELEAALVTADKAHVDQGTKLATLKAAVLADPIKTPAYRRRIALLEAALTACRGDRETLNKETLRLDAKLAQANKERDALMVQFGRLSMAAGNPCLAWDAETQTMPQVLVDYAASVIAAARAELSEAKHQFQNFHRLLCERFGYGHDPVDWQRDQLSLIEWIDEDYIRPWQVARAELEACRGDMDIQAAELARTEQQLADCREASEAMRAALTEAINYIEQDSEYPNEECQRWRLALKPSDAKEGT